MFIVFVYKEYCDLLSYILYDTYYSVKGYSHSSNAAHALNSKLFEALQTSEFKVKIAKMSDSDDESVSLGDSSESDSGSLGSDDSSPKPVAKKQKVTKQTPVKPPPTAKPSKVSVQAKPSKVIQQSTVPKQSSSMSHSTSNVSAPPISTDTVSYTHLTLPTICSV